MHTIEQVYNFNRTIHTESRADGKDDVNLSSNTVIIDAEEIVVPTSIGMSALEVSEILSAIHPSSGAQQRRRVPQNSAHPKGRDARSSFMQRLTRLVSENIDVNAVSELVNSLLR